MPDPLAIYWFAVGVGALLAGVFYELRRIASTP